MKLKKLVIQGFKSFKDRTTIQFNTGITGIVGPNGCGKSNIVDALFWAMGEQSVKHLRGDAMKDLIFTGSSKHAPSSWAEVTLVLDNEDNKHIHIGNKVARPTEIAVTRKIYRNGETEYRINNQQARLRDIQEVFMGTGAGAKSYSIIAQGEIDKFIKAKPVERRFFIEEVAGVTKFKFRKKESQRKIEQTQANLVRLEDLRQGVEKNLQNLRSQSEKVEKAKSLREKIKRNDLIVASHKLFDIFKNYKIHKEFINEHRDKMQKWEREKNVLEESLRDERQQREQLSSNIDQLQRDYRDISKKYAAGEQKSSLLIKQKNSLEVELQMRKNEVEELKDTLKDRRNKMDELEEKRKNILQNDSKLYDENKMQKDLFCFKDELQKKGKEIENIKNKINEINDLKAKNNQEIFKIESGLETLTENLKDVGEELDEMEAYSSNFSDDRTSERKTLVALKQEVGLLESNEVKEKSNIHKITKEWQKIEQRLSKKHNDLVKIQASIEPLMDTNHTLREAKKFVSDNKSHHYSILGELITSEEYCAQGAQVLIAPLLNAIVSQKGDCSELASWMQGKKYRIDFISTDCVDGEMDQSLEELQDIGFHKITPLHKMVRVEMSYREKLRPIFKGLYLVDTITFDQFEKIDANIKFKGIATFDGKVVVKNEDGIKIYFSPSSSDAMGWIEKNNLLEQKEKIVNNLMLEIKKLKDDASKIQNKLSECQEQYELIRDQFVEAKANYTAKKTQIDLKDKSQKDIQYRINILVNRKQKISKNRVHLLEQKEKLQASLKELSEREDREQDIYENFLEEEEGLQNQYNEKRDEYAQIKANVLNFKERIESISGQITDVKMQMKKEEERFDLNQTRINSYMEEISKINEEFKTLEIDNEDMSFEIDSIELSISREKDKQKSLSEEMNDREEKIKNLFFDINKSEKQIFESKTKMENSLLEEEKYSKDIFEKYRVDLRDVLGKALEYNESDFEDFNDLSSMYFMEDENGRTAIQKMPYDFVRKYGKDLMESQQKLKKYKAEYNRIGNVNWQAVDDYEKQKAKWDFLKSQENELRSSLEDLDKAIAHIDEKSKTRFRLAFEDVNARFEKVFPIIFDGGSAHLEIIGDLDDPECGVDITARPPGKKMQNISLMSGGEKALTAVCLIFSIFLVRPSPFCLLDEVDAPLDDANVGRFNELLREMSKQGQFILVTHNKKTMEFNDTLYGITMQEPGISKAVSVQLQ